ncbi:MAG: hypothetical protein Q7U75_06495, partial [Desulfobacterales bacterium]|nr:hypothetical protein [Desulfobacterales bacterium]
MNLTAAIRGVILAAMLGQVATMAIADANQEALIAARDPMQQSGRYAGFAASVPGAMQDFPTEYLAAWEESVALAFDVDGYAATLSAV